MASPLPNFFVNSQRDMALNQVLSVLTAPSDSVTVAAAAPGQGDLHIQDIHYGENPAGAVCGRQVSAQQENRLDLDV